MRKIFPLVFALIVSACGFHPVYGVNKYTSVGVEEKFANISIDNIPNREGQYLRNALIDRFYRAGRPDNPRYVLSVAPLQESIIDLDITKTSDSTRAQLRITTSMKLIDTVNGAALMERSVSSIVSYNILAGEFATRVSEENARTNALDDLAQQIETQLSLYFKHNQ